MGKQSLFLIQTHRCTRRLKQETFYFQDGEDEAPSQQEASMKRTNQINMCTQGEIQMS